MCGLNQKTALPDQYQTASVAVFSGQSPQDHIFELIEQINISLRVPNLNLKVEEKLYFTWPNFEGTDYSKSRNHCFYHR